MHVKKTRLARVNLLWRFLADAAEGNRALRLAGARDVGVHGGPGARKDGDYAAPDNVPDSSALVESLQ
jgi:hypothetical protein